MRFTENDIRPHDLDKMRFEARELDIAWLNDHAAKFVNSSCPACGEDHSSDKFSKFGFKWQSCDSCHTAYMTPRPTAELLSEFYSRSELYKIWDKYIFPRTREVRREKIFKPRVEKMTAILERFDQTSGVLIEVGAAHGIFCKAAQESGRFERVIAIEPSAEQAKTCRSQGIETIESLVEDVRGFDGVANIVASFEVVEHMAQPFEAIKAMGRLLAPGGILLLSTPNVQGFEIEILGAFSDAVYPEHVTLFSPDGLKRLAARAGFETLEVVTPGVLDADIVRTKALSGEIDLSSQPFLRKILIEQWEDLGPSFQEFLASTGQSSHMWFAAQKG